MKDNYGNEIEYDVNAWVGEDNISNNDINLSNNKRDISATGLLSLSLNDKVYLNQNTSILISIINENFEINDLYLYSKNDYFENYNLKVGNYDVLLVKNMATNEEYDTNITSFQIRDGENTNLLIIPKKITYFETYTETILKETEVAKKDDSSINSFLSVVTMFLFFSLLYFISVVIIKYKFRGKE